MACSLGLPADRLVYGDTVEQVFWQLVLTRLAELTGSQRTSERENQAIANANAIGRMLRSMFRRRASRG